MADAVRLAIEQAVAAMRTGGEWAMMATGALLVLWATAGWWHGRERGR